MLNRGFAFIPLLVIIGTFFVGVASTVVVVQRMSAEKTPSVLMEVEAVSNESPDAIRGDEISAYSLDAVADNPPTEEEPVAEVLQNNVVEVQSTLVDAPLKQQVQVEVVQEKPIVESIPTPVQNLPVPDPSIAREAAEATELQKVQSLTYDQVKLESSNLLEGINYLQSRYDELESFQKEGLSICEAQYSSDIAYAKSDAESQKSYASESRSGFATLGNSSSQIDQALAYEIQRIESVYTACKNKYSLDSSIESDIKSLKSARSSVMTKLTKENSTESLKTIRSLTDKALAIGYKM